MILENAVYKISIDWQLLIYNSDVRVSAYCIMSLTEKKHRKINVIYVFCVPLQKNKNRNKKAYLLNYMQLLIQSVRKYKRT